jgi:hypothetical protein
MNIWLAVQAHEGELFATTHLTQKGAWLTAIYDVLQFLSADGHDQDLDDFKDRYGIESDEDLPPNTVDELEALTSEELSKVFHTWNEYTWDNQSGYMIEVMQRQLEG